LWFVSELYYPELTSTGYYVTGIAEGLAKAWPVSVLCSQPTYAARGTKAAPYETRHGVAIWRCIGTTLDKDRLQFRLLNLTTISLSVFAQAVRRFQPRDVVVVTTNPPTLPFVTLLACWIRRATCVLLVHDVYPDVLVASGWTNRRSLVVRVTAILQRALYASMARIIVIGRDMGALVGRQVTRKDRIVRIPNWADIDEVRPSALSGNSLLARLGLADKFVAQYSGNIGRTHGIEHLVEAAASLRSDRSIHFLFIGNGAKRTWLQQEVKARGLANISVLPYQPRDDLSVSLGACDVAIVSLGEGMSGVSVPSRMYNILASGKPIIAVADADSELATVVREEGVGWIVPPARPAQIAAAILEAKLHPEQRTAMGTRGRTAAEQKYRYDQVIAAYRLLLSKLPGL
jgi:glycosyltransferase involved in cell wall biosynthesis